MYIIVPEYPLKDSASSNLNVEDLKDRLTIYGSWNNWTTPLTYSNNVFYLEGYEFYYIKDYISNCSNCSNVSSIEYKIKIDDKYVVIDEFDSLKNGIFINNVITKNNDGYYTNGVMSYKFDNNRVWIKYNNSDSVLVDSEAINCLPYGHGKEYHTNGNLYYEGLFVNGCYFGYGKEYDCDGNIMYEGEYLNGYRYGDGVEYNSNGTILHKGEFLNDEYKKNITYYTYIDISNKK